MTTDRAASPSVARQKRHSVAEWFGRLSLRVRLLLFVAAIVAAVVTAVAVLEVRSFERTLDQEIEDAARLTAQAVGDVLITLQPGIDPMDVRDTLHEIGEGNPLVRSISVVKLNSAREPELVASTLSEERAAVLSVAGRALLSRTLTTERGTDLLLCAVPVASRDGEMAAVSTVSLAPVQQVSERGRAVALIFALPIIVLVTLLVDLTTRVLVHGPVAGIRETMRRASLGELGSRAPVVRPDELGAVATGLNEMLGRLEDFNSALQERVREATEALRLKNAQLGDSYYQMLMLREALARAERLAVVGHMAATVAHQAGTPLNLVSGYVQMMRDDPSADPRMRERLGIVETQIRQVTKVLRTMLDQARQPLRREETNLGELVGRVCDLAGPRLAQNGIALDTDLPPALPPIDVDVVQFEIALLALISNAIDAMPGGGTLTIHASSVPDALHLEVTDTGGGIQPELIDRVFEPWMTTKPEGQGTGLGLGIARDVVRLHGGTITVRNTGRGGATFIIDVPRRAAPEAQV